ncbi:MAG TPA: hypothetical protein VH044_06130 [Polyangiaceae bacterium]|nr:hypothetical protein [Polyangiaceae bacterium]
MKTPTLLLSLLALAIGLSACGGSNGAGLVPDGGVQLPPADASLDVTITSEASTCASGDPSCADADAEADAGPDAMEASAVDAGCAARGPIAMAGDYTGPDGSGYWLRQTATATTFTEVPAGAPVPSTLPRLFRITSVCAAWLVLESTDGAFGRLDWGTVNGGLGICVRGSTSADAANALALPDPGNQAMGCDGSPWTALTKVTP